MKLSLPIEMLRLNRQQWAEKGTIADIQLAKLQRQVRRAWDHSKFYREQFSAAGFHPDDLKSLDDLKRIPIVSKGDMVAAGQDVFCRDIDRGRCIKIRTSGSSGQPFELALTRYDKAHRVLKEIRGLQASGYRYNDLTMVLWIPRNTVDHSLIQKFGLMQRTHVSVASPLRDQIAAINKHQPQVLYSYASNLRIIAEAILSGDYDRPRPHPKILMSASELLDTGTRHLLTEAFKIEPIDFYGSLEFGWIAWQCPERKGYHINSDCVIVECLKDGLPIEPGEEGDLVITNLHSDATPLIRYSIGDRGILGRNNCACGRNLPILAEISGRILDCITLPGGKRLSPAIIACALTGVTGIHKFQVIQEADGKIRVRLTSSPIGVKDADVLTAVHKAIGDNLNVIVERTNRFFTEPNGKFKLVKSMITSATAGVTPQSSPVLAE